MNWLDVARAHHEAIAVGAPLAGAALAVLVGGFRAGVAVSIAAAALATLAAADAAARALLGAAEIPQGEGAAVFAAPLIAAGVLVSSIAGAALLRRESGERAAAFSAALSLIVGAAWLGALYADDLVSLAAAAALGWLSLAGLTALSAHQQRGALGAALRMLLAGGLAALIMLIGAALLARGAGGYELSAFAALTGAVGEGASVGAALMIAGLAVMAGLAPLHDWAAPAFGRAGRFALLCVGAVGAVGALAAIARLAMHVAPIPGIGDGVSLGLVALGVVSIALGSVQAIGARHLGRLIGYAAAAQGGCFLIGVGLASRVGYEAALLHLLAQQAAVLAMLGGAAAAGVEGPLARLAGLFRHAPLAATALAAGALCMMGAPLTTGFLARWRLMEASAGGGWWIAAVAAIGASIAGVCYGGRVLAPMLFRRAIDVGEAGSRWRALTLAPAILAAIAVIGAGVSPAWLLRAASAAADIALGIAP